MWTKNQKHYYQIRIWSKLIYAWLHLRLKSYFVELTMCLSLRWSQCSTPLQLRPCWYYWNNAIEIHSYNVVLCECEQYKWYCSFACTFLSAYLSNNGPPEINQWSITVMPRNVKLWYVCVLFWRVALDFYTGWKCFLIFL